jgi:hypothetical protein
MFHPESEVFLPIAVLVIVFTAGTIIPIAITWLQTRAKIQAIEVLRIYAEKGQDPPASVLETVNRINWPFPPNGAAPPKPMRDQSRGEHLTHVAGSVVLAAGSGLVLWWQLSQTQGRLEWLMITALFVTIFFSASAAARLVAALTAGDGKR